MEFWCVKERKRKFSMGMGARIKESRCQQAMTVNELAQKIGKNRATVYRYENDDIKTMTLDLIEKIALALSTTPEYLMGWTKGKETMPSDNQEKEEKVGEFLTYFLQLRPIEMDQMLEHVKQILIKQNRDEKQGLCYHGERGTR